MSAATAYARNGKPTGGWLKRVTWSSRDRAALSQVEQHTNIIDVSYDDCHSGICNSVRLGNTI
jgi:hypothetical protein